MTKSNKRVTVDFDNQSYYLDGKHWESWDNYGEEMADKINDLLNEVSEENKELEREAIEQEHRKWNCLKTAHRLDLENEQLKEKNKQLKKEIQQLKDLIIHMGYTIKNENGTITLELKR